MTISTWADRTLWALDLETTSADPEQARIVQACVARILPARDDGTRLVESQVFLANPGIEIPEEAAAIHGITTEIAERDGLYPEVVLDQIFGALADRDTAEALVIFNARFDLTVLDREIRRHRMDGRASLWGWPGYIVDPLVEDKHIQRYRSGSRKLDATCLHYGAELTAAHDPAHDALAAARLAWRIARTGEVVRRVRDWREESELKRLREDWEAVRNAVRPKVEAKVREVYGDRLDENLVSALGLLDRMLPSEPLVAPKVDHAEILFPMQQELS
jgi:DNA polymerase-3 subunit epsilon